MINKEFILNLIEQGNADEVFTTRIKNIESDKISEKFPNSYLVEHEGRQYLAVNKPNNSDKHKKRGITNIDLFEIDIEEHNHPLMRDYSADSPNWGAEIPNTQVQLSAATNIENNQQEQFFINKEWNKVDAWLKTPSITKLKNNSILIDMFFNNRRSDLNYSHTYKISPDGKLAELKIEGNFKKAYEDGALCLYSYDSNTRGYVYWISKDGKSSYSSIREPAYYPQTGTVLVASKNTGRNPSPENIIFNIEQFSKNTFLDTGTSVQIGSRLARFSSGLGSFLVDKNHIDAVFALLAKDKARTFSAFKNPHHSQGNLELRADSWSAGGIGTSAHSTMYVNFTEQADGRYQLAGFSVTGISATGNQYGGVHFSSEIDHYASRQKHIEEKIGKKNIEISTQFIENATDFDLKAFTEAANSNGKLRIGYDQEKRTIINQESDPQLNTYTPQNDSFDILVNKIKPSPKDLDLMLKKDAAEKRIQAYKNKKSGIIKTEQLCRIKNEDTLNGEFTRIVKFKKTR